jgi:hypothetical protein
MIQVQLSVPGDDAALLQVQKVRRRIGIWPSHRLQDVIHLHVQLSAGHG